MKTKRIGITKLKAGMRFFRPSYEHTVNYDKPHISVVDHVETISNGKGMLKTTVIHHYEEGYREYGTKKFVSYGRYNGGVLVPVEE